MPVLRFRCPARWLQAAGVFLVSVCLTTPCWAAKASGQSSSDHYKTARLLLEDLRTVPSFELGVDQYLLVIESFQKVRDSSQGRAYGAESLLAIGHLYREMAERFGPAKYREKALENYSALLSGQSDRVLKEEAQKAIRQMGGEVPEDADYAPPRDLTATSRVFRESAGPAKMLPVATSSPAASGEPVQVREVRFWSHPEYTRVIVELGDQVEILYDTVPQPDRLYVDFLETKLGPGLEHEGSIEVGDPVLRQIRTGQNQQTVSRVVFDLQQRPYYSLSWLSNPARLVVELRTTPPLQLARQAESNRNRRPSPQEKQPAAPKKKETAKAAQAPSSDNSGKQRAAKAPDVEKKPGSAPANQPEKKSASTAPTEKKTASAEEPKKLAKADPPKPAPSTAVEEPKPAVPKKQEKAKAAPETTTSEPAKSSRAAVEQPPPVAPQAAVKTSSGKLNLSRALGLKVGRVVIDAGHGGHDTGGIGPSGLREKDLVLDVALRLGKLLETGLHADIVYTRSEDEFVPLRKRTELANQSGADLFVSIHANSSRVRKVRGVETYYLNFSTDSWAMTVASRENAASQKRLHELRDLISKIALKEKVDESREFAAKVQSALYKGLSSETPGLRNRGVRKAPFMVLIGAEMPAVLAEIGFLSNSSDEQLLKAGSYRQKVAEHLYKGIADYAATLSNMRVAQR